MMNRLPIASAVALIAACATPQERAEQQAVKAQAYRTSIEQRCAGYGFRPGTDAFAFCVRDAHLCEQQRKEHAFAWNQALIKHNKPGSTYNQASAAATRDIGVAPVCR
jgi:hypothetical protein